MSLARYAPGEDAGGSSAKGLFAQYLQGETPKYAINNGFRADLFRNTLARMFIRVDASEMPLFLGSIADEHTRNKLARRIAGDPTPVEAPTPTATPVTPSSTDASTRRRHTATANGYLDFLIQQVQMPLQEKVQVTETLSDNYVAYAFGQAPPMWQFQGTLINTVQDDQASNMFRLYTQILRATQMARRQKSLSLSFDSYIVNGIITNINLSLSSNNELMVPFAFQLLVKRVFITNYTRGWVPTQANTPFSADLNAIAYDGRPREEGALNVIVGRTSTESQALVTPTPQNQADGRTNTQSGVDAGTAPPNFFPLAPEGTVAPAVAVNLLDNQARAHSQVAQIAQARAAARPPTPTNAQPNRPETTSPPGQTTNSNVAPTTPATNPAPGLAARLSAAAANYPLGTITNTGTLF
jgi:hypothetical protein